MPIELSAHLLQGLPEDRKGLIELFTHAHALGALAGEQERQPTTARPSPTTDHARRGLPTHERSKTLEQLLALATHHDSAMLELRTSGRQRERDIHRRRLGMLLEVG